MAVRRNALFQSYTFIDWLTQGYMGLIGLLVLFFHGDAVPRWRRFVLAHVLLILAVHLLIRIQAANPRHRVIDFLRHLYPVLLYIFFYPETGALNQMFVSGYLDPFFIRLEQNLFGRQPSLVFMEWLPWLPVSELFYFGYFSYYIMIPGVGVALLLRQRAQFFHYLSVMSFVFYLCYLIYIFTPVTGPRIFYPEFSNYRLPSDVQPAYVPAFPEAIKAGPFYQMMAWIYRTFEAPGASFPSSHVAVAICTAYFSFLYLPRIRYLHAAAVILLSLATVYCRYHYAVDVIAAVPTAAVLVRLGNRLYFKLTKTEPGEMFQTALS
jgi:membrane-associated phospholipid phosphatase